MPTEGAGETELPPVVTPPKSAAKDVPRKELPSTNASEDWPTQFVEQMNRYRQIAGLGRVSAEVDLSRDCQAHAAYLAMNLDLDQPLAANVLDEAQTKPGYSEGGARAAAVAMIAAVEPLPALQRWMGQIAGRAALLNPEMQSIGLGFAKNSQKRWITVLDAARGRGEPMVVYPPPGQIDVPLAFSGGPEIADAKALAGFPITIAFPQGQQIKDGRVELHDGKGNVVDGWSFAPDKPVRPKVKQNALALIPKATLRPDAPYRVEASATVDGKPWRLAWSFTTEDDADGKGVWAAKALAKVNAYRAQSALQPVTLDDKLSRGCLAHARYLAINEGHPALKGLNAHEEDSSLPGASKAGHEAGKASDIAAGDFEPTDAIDAWMATLYHRVPILEPNLRSIGFGCMRGKRFGWVTVMNVGGGRAPGVRPHAVFYPAPDQVDVPLSFPDAGEEPNPIPDDEDGRAGFPVTAVFPRSSTPSRTSGKLTTEDGAEVPSWFSSPEKLANPKLKDSDKFQGSAICLIAKDPFKPNTTYHVHLDGQLQGQPWRKKWKFTTGKAGIGAEDATRQVVERVNQCRAAAGLAAVTLDDELRRGCQLHAEYLVRHADALQKTPDAVNDEDPLLPGFTAEGRRSAQRSDVFTNAPVPVIQIDDLMATFTRRILLLDPALQRIGFGCAHDVGRGWRGVLDLSAGRGDSRIVQYPAPDQKDVPTTGFDRPDAADGKPLGFPITVSFPRQAVIRNVQAALTLDGAEVETHLPPPRQDKSQGATVAVQPLTPLRPGHVYAITLSAIVDGREWRRTWQFTTAAGMR